MFKKEYLSHWKNFMHVNYNSLYCNVFITLNWTVEDEFFNKIISTLCKRIPPSVFTDQEILQMIFKWDSEKPWTIEGSTECHCFPSRKPMRYKILIPQLTMVVSLRFWAFQEFYFYLIITIVFWAVMACRNQIKVFKIFRVPPRARQQRYR